MNIIMNVGFKILMIILSLGNVFSAPIKIVDPFIALLPERPHFQIDNNVYLIPDISAKHPPAPPPVPLYLPKSSEIIIQHRILYNNETTRQ
jgi:hypothetical protein